ncbi:armadillo-type protein [Suillus occidentalis]|nr:armadillo-type protein [Suillus occidentalis]
MVAINSAGGSKDVGKNKERLLLKTAEFGNYVVQCCLHFGAPTNDFIFNAMVDRMWEIAQGRFGARSMRACLESPHITLSQQCRIATAVILNSIPLATNPNGALLLTWLPDTSSFPSRYNLFAPHFTLHLSHLCTYKLASLTVLRIVNQQIEFEASRQIVQALFSSSGDHVLTDVLGDQVNGAAVVHKILTSPFIDPIDKPTYIEATKRVLIELKIIANQAYRRLIEEIGLPIPNHQPKYTTNGPPGKNGQNQNHYGVPGLPSGYPSNDQGLASMMASDMAKAMCLHFMDTHLIKSAAGLGRQSVQRSRYLCPHTRGSPCPGTIRIQERHEFRPSATRIRLSANMPYDIMHTALDRHRAESRTYTFELVECLLIHSHYSNLSKTDSEEI